MDEWLQEWLRELPGELANEAVWFALLGSAAWVVKHRKRIVAKLKLTPKPIVVPLESLTIKSKLAQATITAGSKVTASGNVQASTPSAGARLFDEAIELLSVLPRHL